MKFYLIAIIGFVFCFSPNLNDNKEVKTKRVPKKKWEGVKRGVNGTKLVYYMWNDNLKRKEESKLDESYYKKMSSWNINLVRTFFHLDKDPKTDYKKHKQPSQNMTNEELLKLYSEHVKGLDYMLEMAEKYNFEVIVTLGKIGWRNSDPQLFKKHLHFLWNYLSTRYSHHPKFIAYDLLNEPNTNYEKKNWNNAENIKELIKTIRKNDQNTYIVVEASPWALCTSTGNFPKIEGEDKLIFSPHIYEPHSYTYQGIREFKDVKGQKYPGKLRDYGRSPEKQFDKAELRRIVKPIIKYQKQNKCKILVGEFGVARWAPGREKYIEDLISVFEEYNWSWCYHSYGEPFNGFNPTFPDFHVKRSGLDGGVETKSLKVLKNGWLKNKKSSNLSN